MPQVFRLSERTSLRRGGSEFTLERSEGCPPCRGTTNLGERQQGRFVGAPLVGALLVDHRYPCAPTRAGTRPAPTRDLGALPPTSVCANQRKHGDLPPRD